MITTEKAAASSYNAMFACAAVRVTAALDGRSQENYANAFALAEAADKSCEAAALAADNEIAAGLLGPAERQAARLNAWRAHSNAAFDCSKATMAFASAGDEQLEAVYAKATTAYAAAADAYFAAAY